LEYAFVIFWAHELDYDNIQLIDPRQKKHDVGIHKSVNEDLILRGFSLALNPNYCCLRYYFKIHKFILVS